jgi:hypothetical protein
MNESNIDFNLVLSNQISSEIRNFMNLMAQKYKYSAMDLAPDIFKKYEDGAICSEQLINLFMNRLYDNYINSFYEEKTVKESNCITF